MSKLNTYVDKENKFIEIFNPKNGFYVRTGVLDENGKDTNIDPFMRNFPSLLDVGIMGYCSSSNTCNAGCYQQGKGNKVGTHMPFSLFKKIIDESSGKVFEVALGGFGNPNEHPFFAEIMEYCCFKNIVPNYTTAGNNLTDEQIKITKKFAGAVAVSFHNKSYTFNALSQFLDAKVKTNIHYVLGNDSIDSAIEKLEKNDFPSGINAIIFLLYKNLGKIKTNNILIASDPRVKRFYELIDKEHPYKVGLDSCHVPGVVNFTNNVLPECIIPCDAARFSMYITTDGFALPCSFDTTTRNYAYDIKNSSILEAWNSNIFENFRVHYRESCKKCAIRSNCFGGCGLIGETLNLCSRKERSYVFNK